MVLVSRKTFTEAEIREQAFRRALRYAGYLPQSIEQAVKRNRRYIETGADK